MILFGMAYLIVWTTDQFSGILIIEVPPSSSHPEMQVVFLSLSYVFNGMIYSGTLMHLLQKSFDQAYPTLSMCHHK